MQICIFLCFVEILQEVDSFFKLYHEFIVNLYFIWILLKGFNENFCKLNFTEILLKFYCHFLLEILILLKFYWKFYKKFCSKIVFYWNFAVILLKLIISLKFYNNFTKNLYFLENFYVILPQISCFLKLYRNLT